MAMTQAEMEMETAELVPAREVMCTVWYQPTQSCYHQQSFSHQQCGGEGGTWSNGAYFAQNSSRGISVLSGDNILNGNVLGL